MVRTKVTSFPKKKSTPGRNPIAPRGPAQPSPSSASNVPPPISAKRQAILNRGFYPSRYVDNEALSKLNIKEVCVEYFKALGWERFVSMRPPQFTTLTAEFVENLAVERDPQTKICTKLTFTLFGKLYRLTIAKLSEIFGFSMDGYRARPESWEPYASWNSLTTGGGHYFARSSKATHFREPALRYIHRFISCTLSARKESPGVVERGELFLLSCMKNGEQISTGYWLADTLAAVAHKRTGVICIGGIVSSIALALVPEFNPQTCGFPKIIGSDSLDMATLQRMTMLKKKADGSFVLREAADEAGPSDPSGAAQKRPRLEEPVDVESESDSLEDAPVPPNWDVISRIEAVEAKVDRNQAQLEAVEAKVDKNHMEVLQQLELIQSNLASLLSLHSASSSRAPPP